MANAVHRAQQSAGSQRPRSGDMVLRTVGLTKRFGTITAVDGLDIEVRAGEVFGFLGPNGAGKSTTAGMILGLVKPTAGRVELFGKPLESDPASLLRRVGAIIESPSFYPYLSGRDNLRTLAIAAGGVPDGRVDAVLEQAGLSERAGSPFKTYSLGMKQRLGIASTLLTDPDLVILDEPTNGLDPAGQREVRELIPELARQGRAVLLASHLLHEVEQVCDRVAIIRRGKLIEGGAIRELMHRDSYLEITIEEPERAAAALGAAAWLGISRISVEDGRVAVVAEPEHGAAINRVLAGQGLYASAIVPKTSSLEDIFLELTEPEAPASAQQPGASRLPWQTS
ncbi:MAG: ABC transporter ATP-binding protein [Dehalococcoidia bacterium]